MKHIEVVAAIIIHDDKVLCMQRGLSKHDYLTGKYEFPGGKIDPGESRTQALMRELQEEMDLNVNIKDDDYFMTIHHIYPDFEITMHSFICILNNDLFIRKEHTDHKWLSTSEMLSLDWAMADLPIVEKIMAGGLKC
ncbi:MAG: (deoxy)nucleoside triphosphate pyrophosphohydrolase [Saccharofermentanales bacterium]